MTNRPEARRAGPGRAGPGRKFNDLEKGRAGPGRTFQMLLSIGQQRIIWAENKKLVLRNKNRSLWLSLINPDQPDTWQLILELNFNLQVLNAKFI